ncbi:hypothetical protein [Moritella sp. F3]|uniref:hypothetical protein n=1 Tax=Moritella sp. F3 TaxID=2718882 RepID=UPI0018E0F0C5|nr:hypothetical protein [Moritella sp. F3]GIC76255.1 hypothetical protein FMO001_09820 [Moritella sp. F1]GIC82957.1 hypothetical protein FMO003_32370 [Moritella sp. F3]
MRKLVITSLVASVMLSGCGSGGGDSSNSDSGSTPITKYAFQFVQLVERDEGTGTASCTLFDVDGQTAGKETYARVAKDVTVKIYDEDGNFVEDLSDSVSDVGVLNVAKNDIEDGGYLSIIDSPSTEDKYYKVLSIQKALLGDILIEVNRNQGDVSCYTTDKAAKLDTGYASVHTTAITANAYAFNSSQSELAADIATSKEVSAFDSEDVLVRAYNNGSLVDYVFVPTLTSVQYKDPVPLSGVAFSTYNWTIGLNNDELDTLSVRLNQGDYSYPWIDATFVTATGVTTDFAYVDTEMSWSYSATGTTTLNWNFKHNGTLSTTLDVQLPTELIISDNDPAINTVASNFVFQAQGIDSTLTRLQRSEYDILYNSSNTLNHVIYSEVASGEDVVIPNLALANLDDPELGAINLTIAVLSADTLTTDLQTLFMYEHAASDLVSVVLSPADTVQNNKTKYTNTYTLLNR